MPFKSQAQRRKFYMLAKQGKISKAKLKEWEEETGKRKLPERARAKRKKKR